MSEPEHAPTCKWKDGGEPCRRFSTDGTRLGSQIAHEMGTTDEDKIIAMGERSSIDAARASLTGMPEEQAEWEEEEVPYHPETYYADGDW